MSDDRMEQAKRYRHHAEEIRTMVGDWRDAGTLRMVTDLAGDYDKMAANLERAATADGIKPV